MNKLTEFTQTEFVEFIPEKLEYGVLYISEAHGTANHLCPCGCGNEVPIPIKTRGNKENGGWEYDKNTFEKITLSPSLLNTHCPNRAHYFIRFNKIVWC